MRMYLPRNPYLPPGTLREILAYPMAVDKFEAAAFSAALLRLGLQRLVPLLDEVRRWDQEITEDEEQSLAFARVMLHKPSWAIIDEVFDALESQTVDRVIDMFNNDLASTGVLYIGRTDAQHFFARVLHLINDPAPQGT
jgi:putative ATP-binding cassette transporter